MKQFSWPEMVRYWEGHADVRAAADPFHDPDGLQNVCMPAAPPWLNRYYARGQRTIFTRLLQRVPKRTGDTSRALDVGCGTGRWSRLLAINGYATTGIDLQPSVIESNRRRYPGISFYQVPIQRFTTDEPFDLIASVTVLQHIPRDEQPAAVGNIARLLKPAGHVIALETVRGVDAHVFPNSRNRWVAMFEQAGMRCSAFRRYDYNPMLGLVYGLIHFESERRRRGEAPQLLHPDQHQRPSGRSTRSRLGVLAKAVAVQVDRFVDPALVRAQPSIVPAGHCGFLFVKSGGGTGSTSGA